jgi:hypothetical protein
LEKNVLKTFRPLLRRAAMTALLAGLPLTALMGADAKPAAGPYAADFAKMPAGKPGPELFILNGGFAIAEADGRKVLELPGNPLDTFGVLFGPEAQTATDASARIYGTSEGKMLPEFGVGTNDAGGWKLWLLPSQKALVLRKGEEEKARVPFTWTSGKWTSFRLRVAPAAAGAGWKAEGKAWAADGKEPEAWAITATDAAAPPAGRASVWGQPYAGTPIRFDGLKVTPVQ